jgi:(S)-2-hydroxy-acid oxidase
MFFALAVGGEEALLYMLQLLQTELEAAMAICGIERLSDITTGLVTRHPTIITHTTQGAAALQVFRSSL